MSAPEDRPMAQTYRVDDDERIQGRSRRHPGKAARSVPRSQRLLEVVCKRVKGSPALVTVVYPREDTAVQRRLVTPTGSAPLEGGKPVEFLPCACGLEHAVSMARLREAVSKTKRDAGALSTVDVRSLAP